MGAIWPVCPAGSGAKKCMAAALARRRPKRSKSEWRRQHAPLTLLPPSPCDHLWTWEMTMPCRLGSRWPPSGMVWGPPSVGCGCRAVCAGGKVYVCGLRVQTAVCRWSADGRRASGPPCIPRRLASTGGWPDAYRLSPVRAKGHMLLPESFATAALLTDNGANALHPSLPPNGI